jgi:hypothetical protein
MHVWRGNSEVIFILNRSLIDALENLGLKRWDEESIYYSLRPNT